MGVAVGDYDNDGFPDLFVLGYGRCILYHNNGDGTFTDVTSRAGVQNSGHGHRARPGSTTTMTASSTSSSPTMSTGPPSATSGAAITAPACAVTAIPMIITANLPRFITTMATELSPTSASPLASD